MSLKTSNILWLYKRYLTFGRHGASDSAYQGRIAGCCVRGNSSGKMSVRFGFIPKQYADMEGYIPFNSRGKKTVRVLEDPGWHRQDKRKRVRDFKTATFLMWPRVNQMSRTLLFHTHFWQIRYQIKAKTTTHMAKHIQLFLCLLFLKYSILFFWWGETFLGQFISRV